MTATASANLTAVRSGASKAPLSRVLCRNVCRAGWRSVRSIGALPNSDSVAFRPELSGSPLCLGPAAAVCQRPPQRGAARWRRRERLFDGVRQAKAPAFELPGWRIDDSGATEAPA